MLVEEWTRDWRCNRDNWRFMEIGRDTVEIHSKSKCQSPIPQTMTNDKAQRPNEIQNPNV